MLANLKEASKILGRDYNEVYRLHRAGCIPVVRVKRQLLADIEKTRAILVALDAHKKLRKLESHPPVKVNDSH